MNIPLQKIYDGFAQTYEKNRELFDMTEVFNSFYEGRGSKRASCLIWDAVPANRFPDYLLIAAGMLQVLIFRENA